MGLDIRKIVSVVETTRVEMGSPVEGLRRKVATGVVMTNPYAGHFVDDLTALVDLGAELGALLVHEALAALGCEVSEISTYGKAAIVGVDGEIEHAAALIHPRFGDRCGRDSARARPSSRQPNCSVVRARASWHP